MMMPPCDDAITTRPLLRLFSSGLRMPPIWPHRRRPASMPPRPQHYIYCLSGEYYLPAASCCSGAAYILSFPPATTPYVRTHYQRLSLMPKVIGFIFARRPSALPAASLLRARRLPMPPLMLQQRDASALDMPPAFTTFPGRQVIFFIRHTFLRLAFHALMD